MALYIVTRPWFGVKLNQQVEIKDLHPALRSHVRRVTEEGEQTEAELHNGLGDQTISPVVDPLDDKSGQPFDWESVRADILQELEDSVIDHDPEAPAEELAMLLDEEVREGIKLGAGE